MLSFGATKGGALAAEAVVFFDPARAAGMAERRKRGGHLVSKHRFIAAQFEAYLADDLWLTLARHANAMADRLAESLPLPASSPVWPVEANEVFVALPARTDRRLKAAGAIYYVWTTHSFLPRDAHWPRTRSWCGWSRRSPQFRTRSTVSPPPHVPPDATRRSKPRPHSRLSLTVMTR